MIRVGHLAAGAIAGELAMLGISQTRSVAGRRHLFGAGCGCASWGREFVLLDILLHIFVHISHFFVLLSFLLSFYVTIYAQVSSQITFRKGTLSLCSGFVRLWTDTNDVVFSPIRGAFHLEVIPALRGALHLEVISSCDFLWRFIDACCNQCDFLNPSLEHQKSGPELAHPQNSLHMISSSFVQAEASIQAATLCVFWEVTQERAMMILDHFPEESGSESYVVCFFFWVDGHVHFQTSARTKWEEKNNYQKRRQGNDKQRSLGRAGHEEFFLEIVLPYLTLIYIHIYMHN